MSDYLVWQPLWKRGWCRLLALENVGHRGRLIRGLPCAADFPADVCVRMNPDFPNDTLLTDCLTSRGGELVVSQPMIEFLQQQKLPHVEYLPVQVLDHRGRSVEEAYSVVHPISPVDCLDLDACAPTWSSSAPDQIMFVETIVLDPKRIDPTRPLFRPAAYTAVKIIHRSLADALTSAKFTGCNFLEFESYRPG